MIEPRHNRGFVLEGEKTMPQVQRLDRNGTHRPQFDKNKKKIYATQSVCGICGKPVDMTLKWPNPLSKCIDHIIPVAKGGHPSDIDNLQLAHLICNNRKSDKIVQETNQNKDKDGFIDNRNLPQSKDWIKYRASTAQ